MRRIYQEFNTVNRGMSFPLSEQAHHHLFTVLRCHEGEEIIVFNGKGESWTAEITELNKKRSQIKLLEKQVHNPESPLKIHLAQAVSKGDRMDIVMQKATELGVTDITPVLTERGNVKLDAERWEKKLTHWHQIMIHACEQSGRTTLPILHPVIDLKNWFGAVPEGLRLILSPYAAEPLKDFDKPEQVVLLIGPEGGLTEQEVTLATDLCGFHAIKLGPRILRTETAAVSALTVMQYVWGDLA